jgi:hypothetical protein
LERDVATETLDLLKSVDAATFAKLQKEGKGIAGLILVAWHGNADINEPPTHYYHEGSPLLGGYMAPFTLGASEYPKLYKTKRGLLRRIGQFLNPTWANSTPGIAAGAMPTATYGIGWWIHPDIPAYPLPKYMLMEKPFPGCPRQ